MVVVRERGRKKKEDMIWVEEESCTRFELLPLVLISFGIAAIFLSTVITLQKCK